MMTTSVDLEPFTRVVPKYETGRGFRTELSKLSKLTQKTEYEMVKRGHRRCDVVHVDPSSFDKQVEKYADDGLFFLPILRSRRYQGFSHKHFPVKSLGENTFVYGVVSKNMDDAKNFRDAHKAPVDHKTIGELLGYPQCCVQTFREIWGQGFYDPVYEIAVRTEGARKSGRTVEVKGHPYTNQLLRYFGVRILPYFPCNYQCENSIKLGKKWMRVMRDLDLELSERCLELLKMPMVWDSLKGIAWVRHPLFYGVTNSYPYEERTVVRWSVE